MLHPAQKIVLATLVLAIGWGLSWPFRRASHSSMEPTINLNDRTSWADPPSVRQTTAEPTILASSPKVPGTLIHTAHTTSQATRGRNSLSATGATPRTVSQPRTLDRPHVRQVAKPISLAPIGQRSGLPDSVRKGSPPKMPPVTQAREPTALPTRMPSHYEPEYSFPKKTEPRPHGSGSLPEDSRPRPAYATADGSLAIAGATTSPWPHEILHEVQNSDTLEKLARRYLGDPARALEIFDLNRDKLKNPKILPIGAELRIPASGPRMSE